MQVTVTVAVCVALGFATIAAVCDWRSGEIPNWLTLPPIVSAPFAYGLSSEVALALHTLGATLVSAFVPYLLFRRGVMGGGDVKAFAALGAITGFDLLAGIEIQFAAVLVATVAALITLAWEGSLLRTLGDAIALPFNPMLPARWRRKRSAALSAEVRIGGAILVATVIFAAPHLARAWRML